MKRTPVKKVKSRYFVSPKAAVRVYRDGREVCDLSTRGGMEEYLRRVAKMVLRQHNRCCLERSIKSCPGFMSYSEASFDHEDGRGMGGGKRDDRIEKDGLPYNGAAHLVCNQQKGSRFVNYNNRPPKEDHQSLSRRIFGCDSGVF